MLILYRPQGMVCLARRNEADWARGLIDAIVVRDGERPVFERYAASTQRLEFLTEELWPRPAPGTGQDRISHRVFGPREIRRAGKEDCQLGQNNQDTRGLVWRVIPARK